MASFPKRRARRRRPKKVGPAANAPSKDAGQVVIVFGPPGVGTSTVVDCLAHATSRPNIIVPYCDSWSREALVRVVDNNPNLTVFADVDGGLIAPEDVQGFVDDGLLHLGSGLLVRLYSPNEDILERARERVGYIDEMDLKEWNENIRHVEDVIRLHTLQYYMVPNIDLVEAVKQVALRAGIQD